ncbi:MAG: hypothetical protein IV101_01785 [Dechloromonas sp.]|nr:hypothetical protein [Dechloromonas sp.]
MPSAKAPVLNARATAIATTLILSLFMLFLDVIDSFTAADDAAVFTRVAQRDCSGDSPQN